MENKNKKDFTFCHCKNCKRDFDLIDFLGDYQKVSCPYCKTPYTIQEENKKRSETNGERAEFKAERT